MTHRMTTSAALAAILGLLAACSKPASDAGDASPASAVPAGQPTGSAEAVKPPQNDPINTDANKGETQLSPGANSFTEQEARSHIEKAGYTDVGALTKTTDGVWTGRARKGGAAVDVSVDFKGAVHAISPEAITGKTP